MSDSRKQTNAVINDKLQGTVVTYLTCGGIFNNQIKKGLSLHIPVIFFKSVNVWHCYRQKVNCVVHFLRLLAVWWPRAQSAPNNHLLACNFAKYSSILNNFVTGRLSNKRFFKIWLLTTPPHL